LKSALDGGDYGRIHSTLAGWNKVDQVLTWRMRAVAVRHLRARTFRGENRKVQDLRWLAFTAMAAAAVRFSTPSFA
jgi:hypothetical protein